MAYIKNIIKIEMTEAENLKSVVFPMDQRCIVPSAANFRSIQCKVPSSCVISDKVSQKSAFSPPSSPSSRASR